LNFTAWYVVAGCLLVTMALAGTLVKRLPLTTSLLYLLAGVALGPWGAGLVRVDPVRAAALLERVTELAVIVSLFTAGLKLRLPLADPRWWIPVRLATLSMVVTVGLVAAAGVALLGLPLGPAVLLGAILAPTDPVLASDVQVEHPFDRDRLRLGVTGEAGLNDGTAFPFVLLGLGLCGLHDLGPLGWKWAAIDVLWAGAAGLAVGAAAGTAVGRLVLFLRRTHKEAVGLDEFLSLGLLALAYGLALIVHGYGFLAAFAAGVALRRVEASQSGEQPPDDVGAAAAAASTAGDDPAGDPGSHPASDPERAPAYMARAVLGFNEQFERICEAGVVVLLGGMLAARYLPADGLGFAALLFLVIRPLAVLVGLAGARVSAIQRRYTCWFGIRGVGSVYYLAFALQHGVGGETAVRLTGLTLTVVAASVAVHGISVTPLMRVYERARAGRASRG
jgi:NhaP-type Na+/H+ or K+/H+ antiporter